MTEWSEWQKSEWHNIELDNIHLVDVDVLIEEFVSRNEKRAFMFVKWL